MKEFLYENSNISLKDFSLSLLVLKYKHKLSEAVMNDFLNFIKIIIQSPNKCPKTIKTLNKKLENNDEKTKEYTVCSYCKLIDDFIDEKICDKCKIRDLITFVIFDILPQIQSVLMNENYLKQINFKFSY